MKYIVFNWKCNPKTLLEAKLLFESTAKAVVAIGDVEVVICPPFPYLKEIKSLSGVSAIKVGAQDCSWETRGGSYTSEVSPLMLKNMGCEYVILGHSERKQIFGETEEVINKKLKAALDAYLQPILFFGELKPMAKSAAKKEILHQIKALLTGISKGFLPKILFVYEPAYAISTQGGQNLTPKELKEKTDFIRSYFAKEYGQDIKLLYGGSVDENNIQSYLKNGEVDGVVIGQASLDPREVREMILEL
jgi:triosephosphate isomerase